MNTKDGRYRPTPLIFEAKHLSTLYSALRPCSRNQVLFGEALSRKNQVEALKFAEQRFKVGDTRKLEWLGAQLQSATLQDQQLSVEQTIATGVVTFYKALGDEGWLSALGSGNRTLFTLAFSLIDQSFYSSTK